MKDIIDTAIGYYDPDAWQLSDFIAYIDRTTTAQDAPHAASIEKNIPLYDMADLRPVLEDAATRRALMIEWASILRDGAGVVALKHAYADTTVLDEATALYEQIIAREK